jgi:hypothetical protein
LEALAKSADLYDRLVSIFNDPQISRTPTAEELANKKYVGSCWIRSLVGGVLGADGGIGEADGGVFGSDTSLNHPSYRTALVAVPTDKGGTVLPQLPLPARVNGNYVFDGDYSRDVEMARQRYAPAQVFSMDLWNKNSDEPPDMLVAVGVRGNASVGIRQYGRVLITRGVEIESQSARLAKGVGSVCYFKPVN